MNLFILLRPNNDTRQARIMTFDTPRSDVMSFGSSKNREK